MFGRGLLLAAFVGLIAVLFTVAPFGKNDTGIQIPRRPGRNNTVLLLTNQEYGLGNVALATSYSLLVNHPNVEVHVASFKKTEARVHAVSETVVKSTPSTRPITFHLLRGMPYLDALVKRGSRVHDIIHRPGIFGIESFVGNIAEYIVPWTGAEYFNLYEEISNLLDEVDPAMVTVDPFFGPAMDAILSQNRTYALLTPNSFKDTIGAVQPKAAILWKYPAAGTGFEFPVPWHQIPTNIYLNFRMLYSLVVSPKTAEKKRYLKEKGVQTAPQTLSDFGASCVTAPLCLSQTMPEADFPMDVIPDNVKACGPILLSKSPVADQDPDMAAWLKRAPTILINLGSGYEFDEQAATEMARALKAVLDEANVQVIWKLLRRGSFSDDFLLDLSEEINTRRLRVEKWLNVDPAAMVETGDVVISIHHGGANCYFEAVAAGIPHIILPQWADLYDYAVRAELVGIGIYGNRKNAPYLDSEELSGAMLKLLGNDTDAIAMKEKAKVLKEIYVKKPGRDVAAQYVANFARQPAA